MLSVTKNIKATIVCLIGIVLIGILYQLNNPEKPIIVHASGSQFSGSETCISCHQEIYDSHLEMAHYETSHLTDFQTIKKIMDSTNNLLKIGNGISYQITERKGKLYQEGYKNDSLIVRRPFDITIGSGKRGQSYLFWEGESLYQLPVSLYTDEDVWVNSPGYVDNQIVFNRYIQPGCLECHATHTSFTQNQIQNKFLFNKKKITLGITCERCHGPAKAHVDFHSQNPKALKPEHIVVQANLTRQQKLDMCALCHSGLKTPVRDPFTFQVGDTLSHFYKINSKEVNNKNLDVHGNQYGLLTASKCFKMSPSMDCSTCHDTHKQESGNLKLFSSRCLSCHENDNQIDCGKFTSMGTDISDNCIDCHMPKFETANIVIAKLNTADNFPTTMRTHNIAIYSDSTKFNKIKAFIQRLNKGDMLLRDAKIKNVNIENIDTEI